VGSKQPPTYDELKARIAELEAQRDRDAQSPRKRKWIPEREYRKIRAAKKKKQAELYAKQAEEKRQRDLAWAEQGRRLTQAKQEHPIAYFFGNTETQRQVFAERSKHNAYPNISNTALALKAEATQTSVKPKSEANNHALGVHLILFVVAAIGVWVSRVVSRSVLDVLIFIALIVVWAAEGLAKDRATRIVRAWYAAFFMVSFAIVAFTAAYGTVGGVVGRHCYCICLDLDLLD
jgi:hypothetical protein